MKVTQTKVINTQTSTDFNTQSSRYIQTHHRKKVPQKIELLFTNQRVQIHQADGSIFIWRGNRILYQSRKGLMNQMSAATLLQTKTQPLYSKLVQAAEFLNSHGYENYFINTQYSQNSPECFSLKYKIEQFRWMNPQIEQIKVEGQQQFGYRISNDDKLACLTLLPRLFLVEIQYAQYIQPYCPNSQPKNRIKQLLQKHNYQYIDLPDLPSQNQYKNEHRYLKVKKKFTIFNIPQQWEYPLWILWKSLNQYETLDPGIAYVQYDWVPKSQNQSQLPHSRLRTPMPKCIPLNKLQVNQMCDQKISLPVLGKINHDSACLYLKTNRQEEYREFEGWFCLEYGVNIGYEGLGCWILQQQNSEIIYKVTNGEKADEKYNMNAIPYRIRIKGQEQRTLQRELSLFARYAKQNNIQPIMKENSSPNSQNSPQNTLINEQNVTAPYPINCKAYHSGYIYIQFPSFKISLSLNLKQNTIKLITPNQQQPLYINILNSGSLNYQTYQELIHFTLQYRDKVFYPQKYMANQQMRQNVESVLQSGQIYLMGCQHLQKHRTH